MIICYVNVENIFPHLLSIWLYIESTCDSPYFLMLVCLSFISYVCLSVHLSLIVCQSLSVGLSLSLSISVCLSQSFYIFLKKLFLQIISFLFELDTGESHSCLNFVANISQCFKHLQVVPKNYFVTTYIVLSVPRPP